MDDARYQQVLQQMCTNCGCTPQQVDLAGSSPAIELSSDAWQREFRNPHTGEWSHEAQAAADYLDRGVDLDSANRDQLVTAIGRHRRAAAGGPQHESMARARAVAARTGQPVDYSATAGVIRRQAALVRKARGQ